MVTSTAELRKKAHELALTHQPSAAVRTRAALERMVRQDLHTIRTVNGSLHDETGCTQPAEEWLLDHAEFLEDQALVIEEELSSKLAERLPSDKGVPRALSLCETYLAETDGVFDLGSFCTFTESYQDIAVLTIRELWAMPMLLRIALVHRLAGIAETIRERRDVCESVDRIVAGLDPAKLDAAQLTAALDEAGEAIPLSGPFVVHLIQHLREWAVDTEAMREWLVCRLDNSPEQLERMVTYEHQWQAAYQMTTGNVIGSLRSLSRLDWNEPFERLSVVERTLREDAAGDYPKLDDASRAALREQTERLARRLRVPENLIARHAVDLAAAVHRSEGGEEGGLGQRGEDRETALPSRAASPAYYLLEPRGIGRLVLSLRTCSKPRSVPEMRIWQHASESYFGMLVLVAATLLFVTAGFAGLIGWRADTGAGIPLWIVIAAVFLLAFPALEWAIAITHGWISRLKRPLPLLRYDFSAGVPREAMTMVVIPVIWSSAEEVRELAERLEIHYLANRDEHIHYALLGDLTDAEAESIPEDEAVLAAAVESIDRLNDAYPGRRFHLFHRKRRWNESEQRWLGWERKRGKLVEFAELLGGSKETSFEIIHGDETVLPHIRYVISLDADTLLPAGSAHRMIGAMHLPYNRPRLNEAGTRVVEGYGVMQPRIGMSLESARRSRLAWLLSGDTGVDPYSFAVSDPYQDGFGQGIFTGKGILDVRTFRRVLCDRIPDNRVLSHDLLEGGFLRAALLSDIELIDSHPATFYAFQQRLHRWVRGDWQLLPWLLRTNKDRHGNRCRVDLPLVTRWQMVDNLRRSLHPAAMTALLFLAWTVYPQGAVPILIIVLAAAYNHSLRQLFALGDRRIAATFLQETLHLMAMPYQAAMLLHAAGIALGRLLFTKRRLLEWVSSAEVERLSGKRRVLMRGLAVGLASAAVLAALSVWRSGEAPALAIGLLPAALWLAAPLVIARLDQPLRSGAVSSWSVSDREKLRQLAGEIWAFFERYVTADDHDLPPDNVQIEPPNGVARRTSPTNIGLYMACVLAARDFGFAGMRDVIERLERTLDTVDRLEKWEGHLFNWYNTANLEPLPPKYVSTVDSGNFVACLIAVREGVAEWLESGDVLEEGRAGGADRKEDRRALDVAFAEELAAIGTHSRKGKPKAGGLAASGADAADSAEWRRRGRKLVERLDALVEGTDFRPLYDHKAKLFSLGYHAGTGQRDNILYDLMASEARQASFVAIAAGQVSVGHWQALGRTMTRIGKQSALLSWSGTMFEYMMPWLLMRTYPDTLWDRTYRAVVRRQLEYARQRGVPMGISESGYYAFDHAMNYQYQAFGVPGLGFKRGLERDLVVSPYATVLALPYAGRDGLRALDQMEAHGAKGEYGYYEAIDFTPGRMPEGRRSMVIKSYMAHHQGMSFLALANLLLPRTMIDRFHRNKQVRAAELLLQERDPRKVRVIRHPAVTRLHKPAEPVVPFGVHRELKNPEKSHPQVCLLSNGTYSAIVTGSGSGYSRYGSLNVTRRGEDPVLDDRGSFLYIRDLATDALWSPSYQPCRAPGERRVMFSLDKAAFQFEHAEAGIRSELDICVAPDVNAEIRRLTLTNTGKEARMIEVTTFQEVVLADPIADEAHPAFSKLFIRTEYVADAECIAAGRRPREVGGEPAWAAHALMTEAETVGGMEFETDRARFVGRGSSKSEPAGIRGRLTGTTGSVADPAFIMRRRFQLGAGERIVLVAVTAAAETREHAVDTVRRFASNAAVERAFEVAWNRSQIEQRHLGLSAPEAATFQAMAGQILYVPPLFAERAAAIARNVKGQSGLWPHGISGDRPIVLCRIEEQAQLPLVMKLLNGHEYLRRMGVPFDLAILNESAGGYQQDLQEALRRAAEFGVNRYGGGSSGVHLIRRDTLSDEDETMLEAMARIVIHAGGPSLRAQLRLPRDQGSTPPLLEPVAPAGRFPSPPRTNGAEDLLFYNGYGGFSPDGHTYRIHVRSGQQPPAPWINVMANPQFGTFVSELGTGYTWWRNSRECKLTPWTNDPVLDPPSEACYLRDDESGEVWTTTALGRAGDEPYIVTHGRGFTSITHERHGIAHEQTVYVPRRDSVKLVKLALRNMSGSARKLSVTYYAEWVLGVRRTSGASFIVSEWEQAAGVLIARNTSQEMFREAHAFLGVYSDGPVRRLTWTADRREFVGRGGNMRLPAALERTRLSGRVGVVFDSCGAVQASIDLQPGEERTLYVVLGCESSREAAVELALKYSQSAACEQALSDVVRFWDDLLEQTVISTPAKEMDLIMNGWLLYQSLCCRMWARTAFYQAGGAFGYRDQLQDSLSMLHVEPELTRRQIVLHASHQYKEGDVQHWWHVETGRGIRTMFSDDLLWLPYAVSRYIEHTGDRSVLDETAPFLVSEPLKPEEHERYEETVVSDETGTVLEHCLRAIDLSLSRFGEHGLPLIGVGDWNDGMNLVGDEGRGESVWLGWFLSIVLEKFADICEELADTDGSGASAGLADRPGSLTDRSAESVGLADRSGSLTDGSAESAGLADRPGSLTDGSAESVGLADRSESLPDVSVQSAGLADRPDPSKEVSAYSVKAATYRERRELLVRALNEHGWDGAWFRRARTDDGRWLGSVESEECRIDAIAQSWAVISGAGDPDKVKQAMASFDRELVDRDLSLVRLLAPAFEHTDPSPGYIQGYPPGIRENGAQYTHGAIWSIVAWTLLGQGDKAFELFHMMSPITHTRTPQEVRRYYGEPYVMAADVYTGEPHLGHAGWTWYTGAAGWMYQAGLEWILGIRRRGNRLHVNPCIPRDWPSFTVDYRFGRTRYRITVMNPHGRSTFADPSAAPSIELVDDGQEHIVELEL